MLVTRTEVGIVTLDGQPGEHKQHKEEDFSGTAGDVSEADADDHQEDGDGEIGETQRVSLLPELTQSGNECREERGAGVASRALTRAEISSRTAR